MSVKVYISDDLYYVKDKLLAPIHPLVRIENYFGQLEKNQIGFGIWGQEVHHLIENDKAILSNKHNCIDRINKLYIGNRHLIILADSIDKRSKFYSTFKHEIEIVKGPTKDDIFSLFASLDIADNLKLELARLCNYNWGNMKDANDQLYYKIFYCHNEADKLSSKNYKISSIEDFSVYLDIDNFNKRIDSPASYYDMVKSIYINGETFDYSTFVNVNLKNSTFKFVTSNALLILSNLYNMFSYTIRYLDNEKLQPWEFKTFVSQWTAERFTAEELMELIRVTRLLAMAIPQGLAIDQSICLFGLVFFKINFKGPIMALESFLN